MQTAVGRAAGRINLIGEHTDYNDGFVLPIALRLAVTASTSLRHDGTAHVRTDAELTPVAASYRIGEEQADGTWIDRIRGVTTALLRRGVRVAGFDAEVTSDLPAGAGLGSSAAFTVAVLRSLAVLFDLDLSRDEAVRIAHESETFAGARSGLLDQMASVYGKPSAALLIDMRDLRCEPVALPSALELAVIDSGTRHEHATGGYNRRREECEEACRHLGVASLRELEDRPLEAVLERLPAPLDRRVRHVLTENARVHDTIAALRENDLAGVGRLLLASHESLRDDYEVSTPELDGLVDAALGSGALGARLVGGGFGGSIIALAPRGSARTVADGTLARSGGARLVAVVP